MKDIYFPYYSGNIYKSEVKGHISLNQFIRMHKVPNPKIEKLIFNINKARISKDTKLKNKLKTQLPTFTPSVFIDKGQKRQYANIKGFTGLMQLDFDKIESVEKAMELKEHVFNEHKEVVCAYVSPSRRGVKCLLRIAEPIMPFASLDESIEHYKATFKAVEAEFEQYGYFDTATKNAILPLFLSVDSKMLYRNFEDCEVWNKQDWSKTDYKNLNDEPRQEIKFTNNDYYFKKVERLVSNRINQIIDNGHPQVRTASLILGSRVAAGYISRNDAESLITNLIRGNSYLSKGTKGYIKTALWGIDEGMKTPKYF